jgi:NADH-quinone oxidoreductase subunit M
MIGLLNVIVITPIIGAIFTGCVSKNTVKGYKRAKTLGVFFQLISLLITYVIYRKFDISNPGFQLDECYSFFGMLDLHYHLAIDGISLPLIILTNILMPSVLIATWRMVQDRVKEYVIFFLVMQGLIIGSFLAIDLLIFYFFFEFMLLPMYLIIGIWGGENRVFAAFKFFLYTFCGSILFFLSLIYLYSKLGGVDLSLLILDIKQVDIRIQRWLWLAFFISFAIKVPMWPFHTWLPDAHVQAPTGGSMVLAGILLKIGGYGMLRFLLPIFPEISQDYSQIVMILSVIAIIYASLVAFAQEDMKKLIAYSSVAHMGYVTAGIFSGHIEGLQGSMVQMISHGLISAGLFFVVGIIYDRLHTKQISQLGGIAKVAPNLSIAAMFLTMSSVSLPGTSGFVGELLVLMGMYKYSFTFSLIGALGVIFSAAYMLMLYRKIFYGEITSEKIFEMKDINRPESIILVFLIISILIIGIYPSCITKLTTSSFENLLAK